MVEANRQRMRRWQRRISLVLVTGIGCLLVSGTGIADEAASQADAGYMLIRVKLSSRERVDVLAMSNVDTKDAVRIHEESFEPAGVNAWMALVPMPAGRYFLSEYQPRYGISTSENRTMAARQTRSEPGSESNTFEIVPGVVNYVGDWTLRMDASRRMRFEPTVEFDKSTLEMYLSEYPETSGQFEIYLSVMGDKAIALSDLVKPEE